MLRLLSSNGQKSDKGIDHSLSEFTLQDIIDLGAEWIHPKTLETFEYVTFNGNLLKLKKNQYIIGRYLKGKFVEDRPHGKRKSYTVSNSRISEGDRMVVLRLGDSDFMVFFKLI